MTVSSITQAYLASLYTDQYTKTASNSSVSSNDSSQASDSASISEISQQLVNMPSPPHEMDFENLSDEELKEYLEQMYAITGTLPGGMEKGIEELTDEELGQIRATLVEMSKDGPIAEAMSSENASNISADDFKTLLTLFMLSMQNNMSLTSSGDSSSNDDYFSTDNGMNMALEMILSKISGNTSSDSTSTNALLEQMISAYESNMLSV